MRLLIANGRLVDGKGNITENAWVAIKDQKIEKVGSGDIHEKFKNYSLLDAAAKTVLPGLIDSHVHIALTGGDPEAERLRSRDMILLEAAANSRRTLFAGITTIRDMGSFGCVDISLRDAIERKFIIGPRIICSGRAICITGGHGWMLGAREADGVEEVRKAVREQLKAGIDNLKILASGGFITKGVNPIHSQFSLDELKVAVEEARKAGRTIAAHSHPAQSTKDCVIAGIDSIQHGTYADDEAIRMMVEKGASLSPTLITGKHTSENLDLIPEWLAEKVKDVVPIHHQNMAKAYQAGVKIVMGSDAGSPLLYHGKINLKELNELVSIGMTAHEAIQSATSTAAEVLGVEESTGSVQEGKLADIIVVDGNPLDDITILEDERNIRVVIKEGEIIKDSL